MEEQHVSGAPRKMFVLAAQVAAHLHSATKLAKHLSLTAKNARAITSRAGQAVSGFTAITGFIQELATTMIHLSQKIDHVAVAIAMHAAQMERTKQANKALSLVRELAKGSEYVQSISPFLAKAAEKSEQLEHEFAKMLHELIDLVEQTRMQIRSAEVISTMSKIEASKAGEYEESLHAVTHNITNSAVKIRRELESAESILPTT